MPFHVAQDYSNLVIIFLAGLSKNNTVFCKKKRDVERWVQLYTLSSLLISLRAPEIIGDKASAQMTDKYGESRSPYLIPLCREKGLPR